MKVLVVDDDEITQSMLKELLQHKNGVAESKSSDDVSSPSKDDDAKHEELGASPGAAKKRESVDVEVESAGYRLLGEHMECEDIMDEQRHRLEQVHLCIDKSLMKEFVESHGVVALLTMNRFTRTCTRCWRNRMCFCNRLNRGQNGWCRARMS